MSMCGFTSIVHVPVDFVLFSSIMASEHHTALGLTASERVTFMTTGVLSAMTSGLDPALGIACTAESTDVERHMSRSCKCAMHMTKVSCVALGSASDLDPLLVNLPPQHHQSLPWTIIFLHVCQTRDGCSGCTLTNTGWSLQGSAG